MYSILLIDDHPEPDEIIKVWIDQERKVYGKLVTSMNEAQAELEKCPFHMCIYHLNEILLEELELMHRLQDTPILFVGQITTYAMLDKLLNAGVIAFIENDSSTDQIIRAVRNVLDGLAVLPVSLLHKLHNYEEKNDYVLLNNKECSILKCVAEGKSNKELADIFCVSQRTVEYYLTNIFNKFKVHSRFEAVVAAKQRGMINV